MGGGPLRLIFLAWLFFGAEDGLGSKARNNRKGGTASLRSRTCVKRNAVFGARFKDLSLHFLYEKGNLIRIKTGLDTSDTYPNPYPLSWYPPPPYDYSKKFNLA